MKLRSEYRSTDLRPVETKNGNVTRTDYYDEDGNLRIAGNVGYATKLIEQQNNSKLETYLDDRGERIARYSGYYGILREYDAAENNVRVTYLGLQRHQWCVGADEKLCRDLMEYVMKCGNFGVKLNQTDALCVSVLYQMRHPLKVIRALQEKGCEAWAAAKNPILRPFAWIVEGSRRMRRSKNALEAYRKAKRINALFKSLGVVRHADGLVVYEEGRYYKQQ